MNLNISYSPTDETEDSIPLCQPSQGINLSPENDKIVTLRDFICDDKKVLTQDRNRFLLGACRGVILNFSLKVPPYSTLTNRMIPTNEMLKQELMRRNPTGKELRQKKEKNLLFCLSPMHSPSLT